MDVYNYVIAIYVFPLTGVKTGGVAVLEKQDRVIFYLVNYINF